MMQNELKNIAISLQSKIEKLIFMHNKALEDNLKLQAAVDTLQGQLEFQTQQTSNLEQEISLFNTKKMGFEEGAELQKVSVQQINEMVRDIDKCIALLSINNKKKDLEQI